MDTTSPAPTTSTNNAHHNPLGGLVGLAGQVIGAAYSNLINYHDNRLQAIMAPPATTAPTTEDLLRSAAQAILDEAAARSAAAASASASAEASRMAMEALQAKLKTDMRAFLAVFRWFGLLVVVGATIHSWYQDVCYRKELELLAAQATAAAAAAAKEDDWVQGMGEEEEEEEEEEGSEKGLGGGYVGVDGFGRGGGWGEEQEEGVPLLVSTA